MQKLLLHATIFLFVGILVTTSYAQTSQISGGNNFSVGLVANGTVYVWGSNQSGQLGQGSATASSNTAPIKVQGFPLGLSFVQANAGSGAHGLALDCSGHVWVWGENACGQVGNGSGYTGSFDGCTGGTLTIPVPTPNEVLLGAQTAGTGSNATYLHSIKQISGGNNFSLAVDSSGNVWAWGENAAGELGNGTSGNISATPVQVIKCAGGNLTNVVMAQGSDQTAYALDANGQVWAWGLNNNYNLGNGTSGSNTTGNSTCAAKVYKGPSTVGSSGASAAALGLTPLTGIKQISAGDTHGMALDSIGQVWTWGGDWAPGQLGQGYTYVPNAFASRVVAPGDYTASTNGYLSPYGACTGCTFITNAIGVAAGQASSVILLSNGEVVSFGGLGLYPSVTICAPTATTGYLLFSGTLGNGIASTGGTCQPNTTRCTGYVSATSYSTPSGCAGYGTPTYVETSGGIPLKNIVSISRGDAWYFAVDAVGNTYAWGFNGASGAAEITATGNWGGELGIGNNTDQPYAVKVTMPTGATIAKSCPGKPSLGQDFSVCPGSSFYLTTTETAIGYTYNWYSSSSLSGPYNLIGGGLGDSGISVIMGTSAMYYMVKVSYTIACGACTPAYDTVMVSPLLPNYTGNGTVSGSNATFTVAGTGAYKWYTTITGGTSIGEGATLTEPLSSTNKTYGSSCPYALFVEDTSTYTGALLPTGPPGGCSTGTIDNASGSATNGTYLLVAVNQTITINSVQFAQSALLGAGTGNFSFVIYSNNPTGGPYCGSCSPQGTYEGPASLLYTSPPTPFTISTSNITRTLTGNYTLPAGKYWIGLTMTGNTGWTTYECNPSFTAGTDNWTTQYTDNTGYNLIKATGAIYQAVHQSVGSVFNIQFTVGNSYPCNRLLVCANTTSGSVAPTVTISSLAKSICIGDSLTLTANASAGSGSYEYNWTPGYDTTANITAKPSITTTYTVKVTDKKSGLSSTDSVSITANRPVSVVATTPDSVLCLGNSVKLTATASNGSGSYSYNWTPGTDTLTSITVKPTLPTTYTVSVTDKQVGCGSSKDSVKIDVNTPTSITITLTDSVLCLGDSVKLTAAATSSSGSYSYKWTPGADTLASITVKPTLSTTYMVGVTDKQGVCSSSKDSVIITVNKPVSVVVTMPDSVLCLGDSVKLTASVSNGSGFYNYKWSPAQGLNSPLTDTVIAKPADTMTYKVIATDTLSACPPATDSVTIDVNPLPSISISRSYDTLMAIVTVTSPYTYSWQPTKDTTNKLIVDSTGSYTVEVTDINGCFSISAPFVVAADTISGIVTDSAGALLPGVEVYLIRLNPDSSLTKIDSALTNSSGVYFLNSTAFTTQLYIYAVPGSVPTFLPSYYPSSFVIQNSGPVNLNSSDSIKIINTINAGGTGTASGTIYTDINNQRLAVLRTSSASIPVVGLKVFVVDSLNNPVEMTVTDSNGYFIFTSLPNGIYQLWVDKLGVNNLIAPSVTITPTDTSSQNMQFLLYPTYLDRLSTTITSIASSVNPTVLVYPNPATSELTVRLAGGNPDNFTFSLINLDGKEVLSGEGNSTISVTSLSEGFYILKTQLASGYFLYNKLIIER